MATPPRSDPMDVVDRFLDAVVAGDVDAAAAIYHPDAVVWQSNVRIEQPAAANLRTLRWMADNLSGFRYENVRRYAVDGGVVEQHDTVVPLPGRDDPLVIPVCMVVLVDDDGRITRLDEYLDSTLVDELVAAVARS